MRCELVSAKDRAKHERHMNAYECAIATCRLVDTIRDTCAKQMPLGQPETCPGFQPEQLVGVVEWDGELCAVRMDARGCPAEPIAWFPTYREAQEFISKSQAN